VGQGAGGERQKPLQRECDHVSLARHYAPERREQVRPSFRRVEAEMRLGKHALAPLIMVTQRGMRSPGLDCRRQMRGTSPSFASYA
jgi:hypothetical protein